MATKIKGKNGREITLLNPSERGRKFADELGNGVKQTNNGLLKTDVLGKPVKLTEKERAYRAGYLDARQDSAEAYKHNQKKKAAVKEAKKAARKAAKK